MYRCAQFPIIVDTFEIGDIIYIVDIVDMVLTINKINIRHSLYCGHGELTHLVVPRTCLPYDKAVL